MTDKSSYQPGEPTWVDLCTPDLERTRSFYGDMFGWTAPPGSEEFGGYTNFEVDGKKVAGLMPLMSPDMPPVWSTYFSVEDADKTTALVQEHGGTVVSPPMAVAALGTMAVFTDPVGAFFGIWQPGEHIGAERIDSEGTLTWVELQSRDLERSHAFYGAVFGWEPRASDGYTEYQLAGRSVAGGMTMPEMVPAEVPSYWMPYFAASDPDAKAQQAVQLGGQLIVPLMDFGGGTFTVVQDPHGSTFGLLHLTTG